MIRLGPALLVLVATSGCAPADACAALCTASLARFEACLDAEGLAWGDAVGYTDPADYQNGCDTFAWELRELGEADTCDARLAAVEAPGDDPCARNYDTPEGE